MSLVSCLLQDPFSNFQVTLARLIFRSNSKYLKKQMILNLVLLTLMMYDNTDLTIQIKLGSNKDE